MNDTALKLVDPQPLMNIGERSISTQGWTMNAAEAHLHLHLGDENSKWCDSGCMARTMFLRNSESNRGEVRRRIARLRSELLTRGRFLVVEYGGPRGRISRFKLFEVGGDAREKIAAQLHLERLVARQEVNAEQAQQVRDLLGSEAIIP